MFDLRWKTCFISDENLVVFHLVFHLGIEIHSPDPNVGPLVAFDRTNN